MFDRFPSSEGNLPEIWLNSKVLKTKCSTKKNQIKTLSPMYELSKNFTFLRRESDQRSVQDDKACDVSNLFWDWTSYSVSK